MPTWCAWGPILILWKSLFHNINIVFAIELFPAGTDVLLMLHRASWYSQNCICRTEPNCSCDEWDHAYPSPYANCSCCCKTYQYQANYYPKYTINATGITFHFNLLVWVLGERKIENLHLSVCDKCYVVQVNFSDMPLKLGKSFESGLVDSGSLFTP